jgi:NitT/TauT family transport system substrate-binding protein
MAKKLPGFAGRSFARVLGATLALALLVPLGTFGFSAPPKGSRENPIRVGSLRITGFAASYLLPELGKQQGLYLEVIDFPRTTERLAALLRGDIDIAFAGWNGTILLAARGDPIVAIASSFDGGYTLTVRTDSGIRDVKELKGKRVAHSIGSNAELHLYSQLKLAGLEPRDVNAVHMGFAEMPIALARGDIDACFCSEPQSSIAIYQGFGTLLKYPYDAGYKKINGVVVTTRHFLQDQREAVRAFLRVFVRGTDTLKQNPQRFFEMAKELFKQPDPIVSMALKNTVLNYRIDTQAVMAMAEWQLRLGQIQRKPPLQTFIDTRVLSEVLKERR